MMAALFWLNDAQWATIEPLLPYLGVSHGWMIAGPSAALCIAFARACAGVRCPPNMFPEPRCSIGSAAGASVHCGNSSPQLLRDVAIRNFRRW